jgi:uncharacterized membrane protein YhhN
MVLDWLAVGFNWQKVRPFTKPLVMIAVIFWTLTHINAGDGLWLALVFLGQSFGLAGDVFLLLPRKWFLWGLAAFLGGHFFYIAALLRIVITQNISPLPQILIGGISVWIAFLVLFRVLFKPAFVQAGRSKGLWIAVQVYAVTLSGFALLAVWTAWADRGLSPGLLAIPAGGVLFLISDSLLAYDRFVRKISLGKLWVRITYHLAQFALAVGWVFWIAGV